MRTDTSPNPPTEKESTMNLRKPLLLTVSLLVSISSGESVLAAEAGAKGLYFEQMKRPADSLNTGVQYWIELHRKGTIQRVSNKESFQSGDKIRFHVKPNIDGYAYILLRSGSRGEQSVLFPDAARGDDNHILRGKDYPMPADGFLTFDNNPGIEKVTLLLSRTVVDADAYLKKAEGERTLIASAADGSKDLIPSKIVLAYAPPVPSTPPAGENAPKTGAEPAKPGTTKPGAEAAKGPAAGKSTETSKSGTGKRTYRAKVAKIASPTRAATRAGEVDEGVITVVYKDPSGVLAVDVALEHN